MTTPGNHEIDWLDYGFYSGSKDSGGECGVPYARRFPMPGAWLQQPWCAPPATSLPPGVSQQNVSLTSLDALGPTLGNPCACLS